jgi:alpha-L-fucosidase
VLTVKHTGGWCLWPSATTTHGVQSFRNFRGGKADLVREFVDACRSRQLKVGLYYCLPGDYTGRFGNTLAPGQTDYHGLPPEAGSDRVGFIKRQLEELLTRYDPDLLWFDQYANKYTGPQWREIKAYVHAISPRCVVVANNAHDLENSDALSYEWPWDSRHLPGNVHGRPGFIGTLPPEHNVGPAELCDTIQTESRWFWHPEVRATGLQTAEQMAAIYRQCRERNANYLLNVPPDRDGVIPAASVERLQQLGALIQPHP